MDIATGAISTLLPKLGELLKEEYKLQKSVRGEIKFLEAELEAMQTALLKISSAPIDDQPDEQVKLWVREVRELSYDLEDNIDRYLVRIDHSPEQLHGLRGFIERSINLLTKANLCHQIGTDIKDIRTRITEVSERRERYKIDNVTGAKPSRPSVDSLRLSALHKRASELIGTKEKIKEVEKMLMEDDELSNRKLKTVSIVGLGGLGKTTLANEVYKKLNAQFDCEAFVSVSLNPKMDQIFKSMLRQLDNKTYKSINGEMWDETQLINELRSLLKNKRYFIVVDDIWNKSVWVNILRALNKCGRGSRIIITTRILDVAQQTDSVYKLQALSAVDSRKLFFLRIFGTEDRCLPKELDKESENILRKCGGVPLAIITISSMLASKKETENTCEYWAKVCKSMGSGLENTSSDVNDMRSILSVSYHDLPLHLRTCLLYLSLYPEDHQIMTHDVIWKWIGEGFVPKNQGMDMFEAGEDYVYELINRSLILPTFKYGTNKAKSFQIHDMVLDLITFLSNEQYFLTKLGAQELEHLPNKIRRLSLHTSNQDDGNRLGNKNCSHVRSLSVFPGAFNILQEISRFPVLRELDLTEAQVGNHHFKDICNLFHLRYLSLPCTRITEIPKEIGNLKFLQVLDIGGSYVMQLPSTFAQLRQLVYLRFCALREEVEDFQILGNLPRLSHLSITVKEPTQSREKVLLVTGNVYPFLCLTKFEIHNNYMVVMFAEGAMQQLRTLKVFVRESMDQFGRSGFGLENLSSLEHVHVEMVLSGAKPEEVEAAKAEIQKVVDINPNKPKLKFVKRVILSIKGTANNKIVIMGSIADIRGIRTITIDDHLGMLTATGMVDPATIIEQLKKASIEAQPWGVCSVDSVEEEAPSPNSTLRRLILKVWGRICCLPAAACARLSSKHDPMNTSSRITETVTTTESASN